MTPIVIATWPFGLPAADAAWAILSANGTAMDAVVAGATQCEEDPTVSSVGLGGLPDASGEVTLDASVMDHAGRCGAVACLRRVVHAARAARMVMERTPHVMLVDQGATAFALAQGLAESNLLTPEAAVAYAKWRQQGGRFTSGHDTLGILALDAAGRLAGACTTSGLAFKMPGRVGDSPLIGAGLYVEGSVGAATATGVGEEMVRACASHGIVQSLRRGMSPEAALRDCLTAMAAGGHASGELDVSLLALRVDGAYAALTLRTKKPFPYAVVANDVRKLTIANNLAVG